MVQMLDTIRYVWEYRDNNIKTNKEIFNYSPSGELFMVWEWYEDSLLWLRLNFTSLGLPKSYNSCPKCNKKLEVQCCTCCGWYHSINLKV